MSDGTDRHGRILYGRRKGRPLRAVQKRRIEEMLPALAVDITDGAGDPRRLFDPVPTSVWLEIGFGGGEHLAEQAAAHPDIGFIGCEPFLNGVAKLLRTIEREALGNVRIFAEDARQLLAALPDASIGRCFILFPDPWPKRRHNRRRIVSPETLRELARTLEDGAALRLASDHRAYIRWMLFHTLSNDAFEWRARGPADWRERPDDWPATRYEEKAAQRGIRSTYLTFARRPRPTKKA